jgi:DNA polymerase III delta prime subunit
MRKVKLLGVWSEAARPQTLDEIILPKRLHDVFRKMIDNRDMPNLILESVSPGTGKTTLSKILAKELQTSSLYINASENGGIDTLRNEITNFVQNANVSAFEADTDKPCPFKVVILDEADGVSSSFSNAARNLLNQCQNVRYILTLNNIQALSAPVKDRCTTIPFDFTEEEKDEISEKFYERVCNILTDNNIEFNDDVVIDTIIKHCPRWRRVWDILYESYINRGKIDKIVTNDETEITSLIDTINTKDYKKVMDFINNSNTLNYATIYSTLFNYIDRFKFRQDILIYLLSVYNSRMTLTVDSILAFAGFVCELYLREKGEI